MDLNLISVYICDILEEKKLREAAAKKEAAEKARKEAAEKAEAKEKARREDAARKESLERQRKEEARKQAEEKRRSEEEAAERQRQVEQEEARREAEEKRRSEAEAQRVRKAEADSKAKLAELKRQQAEAKAAAAKPKIRPMATPARRQREKEAPKVVLTTAKKRKCYMWYARLGQPNKEKMLQAIQKLPPSHEPITVEDVEALPWILGGALLPVKEMNELFMNADKED